LTGAGRLGQPLDLLAQLAQRLAVGVADHRNDEPVLGRGGQADVKALPLDDLARRVVEHGVHLRVLPQGRDGGLDDEGKKRQLFTSGPALRVDLGAQGDQLGAVDLLDVGDVWRRVLRANQLLGDFAAEPPERDAHAVRAWRGRCRVRRARRIALAAVRADVVGGDPASPPSAGDLADVDPNLTRQLARGRGGQDHAAGGQTVAGWVQVDV